MVAPVYSISIGRERVDILWWSTTGFLTVVIALTTKWMKDAEKDVEELEKLRYRSRVGIRTPEAFLKAIGRSCETKLTGVQSWSQLWQTDGFQLKKAGLGVRDRRYILWSMEMFRQGEDPAEFAHRAKPAKKIRGYVSRPLLRI
ncbi:hypothetical protein GSI_15206 [Ganoderma sinense ZZ0214-1]|uniref:Small ribosomal subunit protein mS41 n=1 Tax=Ganoderma sinense ZZ0214-1 TaxID=1077348 RepID=A0A2G8RLX6_9APHY|nr:hypothetical protein GSI_15206 [Ganoderma sinense ZZ0214-1]